MWDYFFMPVVHCRGGASQNETSLYIVFLKASVSYMFSTHHTCWQARKRYSYSSYLLCKYTKLYVCVWLMSNRTCKPALHDALSLPLCLCVCLYMSPANTYFIHILTGFVHGACASLWISNKYARIITVIKRKCSSCLFGFLNIERRVQTISCVCLHEYGATFTFTLPIYFP